MTNVSRDETKPARGILSRLRWICPIIGLVAGATILWLFGFGLWTMVVFLCLIACPFVVAWVLVIERQENRASRKQP